MTAAHANASCVRTSCSQSDSSAPSNWAACTRIRLWVPRPLMKQTFMDAEWYGRAWGAYETSGRSLLPPETSEALASLSKVVKGTEPVFFQRRRAKRNTCASYKLAQDYKLTPWFRGSGEEYRLIDVLKGRTQPRSSCH